MYNLFDRARGVLKYLSELLVIVHSRRKMVAGFGLGYAKREQPLALTSEYPTHFWISTFSTQSLSMDSINNGLISERIIC